jgi:CRP/FNR family transcriptional regulator, cyclic AMP receptor protein
MRSDLATAGRVVSLPAGRPIYDPQFSIVMAGTLRAFVYDGNGRHLTVSYLQRPQEIGVSSVAGLEFPVAFQAVTPCTIFRLPQSKFEEIRQVCPAVGWSAAKELARNLDAVLNETSRVAFQPVKERVAHHLIALSECHGRDGRPIHQAELAAAVGSVREVVNRTLGHFRDAGLIAVDQTGITDVDIDALRQVAGQQPQVAV